MKNAREIACTGEMGDCGAGWDTDSGHSAECDARTEAIQQAREDGARWAIEAVRNSRVGCWPQPADVRKAGDGDETESTR